MKKAEYHGKREIERIRRSLKSGVMKNGLRIKTEEDAPQGGPHSQGKLFSNTVFMASSKLPIDLIGILVYTAFAVFCPESEKRTEGSDPAAGELVKDLVKR